MQFRLKKLSKCQNVKNRKYLADQEPTKHFHIIPLFRIQITPLLHTANSQSIGRVIVISEYYRILPNKNREAAMRIAYNSDMAKEVAKKAIRHDLESKGKELHGQLDEILGKIK